MTLALYGKSKGRQATLVVAALFAILVASVGALWFAQRALAHHPTYVANAFCNGDWNATSTYVAGGDERIILISNVTINGVPYEPAWSSGIDDPDSVGPVLLSAYTGNKTGLPAAGPGIYVVYADDGDGFTVFNRNQASGLLDLGATWSGTISQYYWTGGSWQLGGAGGLPATVNVYKPGAPGDCVTIKKVQVGGTPNTTFRADIDRIGGGGGGSVTDIDFAANNPQTRSVNFDGSRDFRVEEDDYSGAGWATYYWYSTASANEACPAVDSGLWTLGRTLPIFSDFPDGSKVTVCFGNVKNAPDLKSEKTGPANVTHNTNITYTVTVTNIGTATANDNPLTVTDTIPAGTTYVSANKTSGTGTWACGFASGTVTCQTNSNLEPGQSAVFTIVVKAPNNVCAPLKNKATVSGESDDSNTSNNTSNEVTTNVTGCYVDPKIKVAKVVGPGGSDSDLFSVDISGVENNIPFSVVTNPTRTVTYNGDYTVTEDNPSGVGGGLGYENTGYKVVGFNDACPAFESDGWDGPGAVQLNDLKSDVKVCFRNGKVKDTTWPNLKVDKTASYTSGNTISWNIVVTNTGNEDTQGAVAVSDNLPAGVTYTGFTGAGWACNENPAGTITCTTNEVIAAGGDTATTLTLNATIAPDVCRALLNTVTVSGGGEPSSDPDNVGPENTDTTNTNVNTCSPNVSVEKTDNQDDNAVSIGGTIVYTVKVKNTGSAPATGYYLVDDLEAGTLVSVSPSSGCTINGNDFSCAVPTIAAGGEATYTVTVTANNTCTDVTNIAYVRLGAGGANLGSSQADPIDVTGCSTGQTGAKYQSVDGPTGPWVQGDVDVNPGDTLHYRLVLRNAGNQTLTNLVILDTLDATGTEVSEGIVNGSATNYCTVTGAAVDCDIASLGGGSEFELIISMDIPATPECGGTYTNTFDHNSDQVKSTDGDGYFTSNPVTANGPDCTPTLNGSKSQSESEQGGTTSPINVNVGDTVYYTLSVTNGGNQPLTNVEIDDTFASAVTVVDNGGGACTVSGANNNILACDRTTLGTGSTWSVKVSIVVQPTSPGSQCGPDIINSFIFDSTQTTPGTSNQVTANVPDCTPTLSGSKSQSESEQGSTTSPISVNVGDTVYYTLSVNNGGNEVLTNVEINDTFPSAVTVVDNGGGVCTVSGANNNILECDRDTLGVGATWTVKVSIVVQPSSPGSQCGPDILNSFTFDSTQTSQDTSNEVVANVPDCAHSYMFTKQQSLTNSGYDTGDLQVTPGGSYFYELVLTNTGTETLEDIDIDDPLPLAGEIVSQSNSNTGTDAACATPIVGNALDCTIDTLYPGATYTIVIEVDVPQSAACETTYVNDATVSFDDTSIPGMTTPEVEATTQDCVADPAVEKGTETTVVQLNESFTYEITVSNLGDTAAGNVILTDTLTGATVTSIASADGDFDCEASGTFPCTIGELGAGASVAFTVTVQANGECTPVNNTAFVENTGTGGNSNSSNDQDAAPEVDVDGCDVDLDGSKSQSTDGLNFTASTITLAGGELVQYSITATNEGNQLLNNVSITDDAPVGTTFVSIIDNGGGTCVGDGPFTCTISSLADGASYTIVFQVRVTDLQCGITVSNTASIAAGSSGTGGTGPGTSPSNTNTVTGEMDPCGSLIVNKTTVVNGSVNGAFDAGWTITIECPALGLSTSSVTGANGVAMFYNLPACNWIVTELTDAANAPFPGFTPEGSASTQAQVTSGGVATVNFVNIREDDEPTPTPTVPTETPVDPTETPVDPTETPEDPTATSTQPVAGETVVNTATPTNTTVPATNTPTQVVGGSTVVATGTPLPPSAGNGIFGSDGGSNMTLAIFGMLAVAGGFILIAFGRRTRNEA